jgi:AraC family transcriptional regulator of adaptative response/methylated-DNA-[protein]-cysteine methyltransferase
MMSSNTHYPAYNGSTDRLMNITVTTFDDREAISDECLITYGIHSSPFGEVLIATTSYGICNLHFLDEENESIITNELRKNWKHAELQFDPVLTQTLCDRIFQPVFQSTNLETNSGYPLKPFSLVLKGTNFQIQVWKALFNIPFGRVITYQDLALWLDRPTAARAVGTAVGKNPIAYLVPCHRVVRVSGALGGYRWGLDRKASILEWEANQLAPPSDYPQETLREAK